MKNHLVNLLLEQYKQQSVFSKINALGVDMSNVVVNNYDIVLDIIGFPRDNSSLYDINELGNGKKKEDRNLFMRDYLDDRFYQLGSLLENEQNIVVSDRGLILESGSDEEIIKSHLLDLINWLYDEYKKYAEREWQSERHG